MTTIKVYSRKQQEAIIDRYLIQGSYRLSVLLHRRRDRVMREAKRRAMSLGVEEYGDAALHFNLKQTEDETIAELADGTFYQTIYSWIENGKQL